MNNSIDTAPPQRTPGAMKVVMLIGGMGSGKSTVSDLFAQSGAVVIDLDVLGHDVLDLPEAKEALVDAFGADILDADRSVNRACLAKKAFASPEQTEKLNAITWRFIEQELKHRLDVERATTPLVVVEASAYRGPQEVWTDVFDAIVAVVAPEDVRIRRAIAAGYEESDVRARIARQATDEQRRAWADYIIVNDGGLDALEDHVASILAEFVPASSL